MKVLSTDGLTKLIQLIKSSFISTSNTVTTNTVTLADVATSGDFDDLINTPTIPTATSDLTNDSGFITNSVDNLTNYTLSSNLSTVATTGNYTDLTNKPTIPTAISDLTDDTNTTPIDKAKSVVDQNNTTNALKYWTGTKAQYDAIVTKDSDTIYNVEDTTSPIVDILNTLYPIGAIYIGTMATCPLSVLGIGTWQLVAQDRVLQGAGTRGTVGSEIDESLPNITGILQQDGIAGTGTTNGVVWGSEGAFGAITSSGVSRAKYSMSTSGAVKDTIPFNASNSSSTYQDNAPVQQDGYLVNIWERIA